MQETGIRPSFGIVWKSDWEKHQETGVEGFCAGFLRCGFWRTGGSSRLWRLFRGWGSSGGCG
jgi:hypothetical protein